jgi:hypothetical protein
MDAHEREGAAAVAAMTNEIKIGDMVRGVSGGREFSGMLTSIEGDRCEVDLPGAWIACRRCDIVERIEE